MRGYWSWRLRELPFQRSQGTLLTEVRGSRTTSVVARCRCSLLGLRKALWNFHLYPLTRALLASWRGLLSKRSKTLVRCGVVVQPLRVYGTGCLLATVL